MALFDIYRKRSNIFIWFGPAQNYVTFSICNTVITWQKVRVVLWSLGRKMLRTFPQSFFLLIFDFWAGTVCATFKNGYARKCGSWFKSRRCLEVLHNRWWFQNRSQLYRSADGKSTCSESSLPPPQVADRGHFFKWGGVFGCLDIFDIRRMSCSCQSYYISFICG